MPKRVKVSVDKRGKIHIEMEGFQGNACLTTLDKILKALGKATSLTPTSEFYNTSTDTQVYEYE